MIKSKNGRVLVKGSINTTIADAVVMLKGIKDALVDAGLPENIADRAVDRCLEVSKMSDIEIGSLDSFLSF